MRKKVAVIFESDVYAQYGVFNAVRNRINFLRINSDFDIDVFVLSKYSPWYANMLHHRKEKKRIREISVVGQKYSVIWIKNTIIDYLASDVFKCSPPLLNFNTRRLAKKFKVYDFISAHSTLAGTISYHVFQNYGIPFFITWHGSDIHTHPFSKRYIFNCTKKLLENAACNFFVSEALNVTARGISNNFRSQVLYNGIDLRFKKKSEEERQKLRVEKGVSMGQKIVAFCGALVDIKNPQILPSVFEEIRNTCRQEILFWMIGEGPLLGEVKKRIEEKGIPCIFWGKQSSEAMSDFYNCIDVLILPSKNEGLPLVTLEALACGSNVVGSNVGGIKESIGKENVFNLDDNFVSSISLRITYMLEHSIPQSLKKEFSWDNTAKIETQIYKDWFENNEC